MTLRADRLFSIYKNRLMLGQSRFAACIALLHNSINNPSENANVAALKKIIGTLEAYAESEDLKSADGHRPEAFMQMLINTPGRLELPVYCDEYLALNRCIEEAAAQLGYNTRPSTIVSPPPLSVLRHEAPAYQEGSVWQSEFLSLLIHKGIWANNFLPDPGDARAPSLDSDLGKHVAWAYENIYRIPYPDGKILHQIPRYFHGIMHVTRTAINVSVFANLYAHYGHPQAQALTPREIKLMQLAALFHDAAREDEGVDKWDHESGLMLYFYLKNQLNVSHEEAKLFAEAIANKDIGPDGYFEISISQNGEACWQWTKNHPEKNIYQKIIHDADCLEIIRARDHYDATYLDFYKEVVCINAQEEQIREDASDTLAALIMEARNIINKQGDTQNRTNPEIKRQYECSNAYELIKHDLTPNTHDLMLQCGFGQQPSTPSIATKPYDPAAPLTEENLQSAMSNGLVFAIGISSPSAMTKKRNQPRNETCAALELRKLFRHKGVPTKSKKDDKLKKEGNPYRSVSMIGFGSGVFTTAGYLIVNPKIDSVLSVSSIDADSGFGKKSHLRNQKRPPTEEIKQSLKSLLRRLKMGGKIRRFEKYNYPCNHAEILYNIKRVDAIYYTGDSTFYNFMLYHKHEPNHPNIPLLEAIFLQNAYTIEFNRSKAAFIAAFGKKRGEREHQSRFGDEPRLPIFHYSTTKKNCERLADDFLTDDVVCKLWADVIKHYIKSVIKQSPSNAALLRAKTADEIKVLAFHLSTQVQFTGLASFAPADSNYRPELKARIDTLIDDIVTKECSQAETLYEAMRKELNKKLPGHKDQIDTMLTNMHITNCLMNNHFKANKTLSDDVIKTIKAFLDFQATHLTRATAQKLPKKYATSINTFVTKGLSIALSSKDTDNKEMLLTKLAEHEFKHRHLAARIFADALMLISTVVGIGIAVGAYRLYKKKPLFFSMEKTRRQKDVDETIIPILPPKLGG